MTDARTLERLLRPILRRYARRRTGRVKAIDNSGDVQVVTVDGRRMWTVQPVAVDDLVVWYDGEPPTCLGPVVLSS